ncbi:centromere protein W isoform X2 [Anguilla anguilla]|uniref:centromere protein W isoform X2 n=1 Tax=Anguilla anguilla TaxID=7936 RepID=UPI0015B2FB57|nr:centromere protein W isoform X2 [Anguilla anguilla]
MLTKAPRKNLKSLMKKKAHLKIGTNADLMVQLSVMMFLHRLAEESRTKAFEEKSATIKPQHIKDVSKKLLKGARG